MSYQGRSPMKDVVRSVVMSAAMVSPALLASCASQPVTPLPVPLDPLGGPDAGAASSIDASTGTGPIAADPTTSPTTPPTVPTAEPTAPPTATVRPRTPPTGPTMPTRGFAGAVRARG